MATVFHKDIRRWSLADDEVLKAAYPKGLEVCAQVFPNRRPQQIIGRAKKLGLSRAKSGPARPWTGADESKLRRMWVNGSREEIQSLIPGRTWHAIVSKANKLSLSPRAMLARRPLPASENPIIQEISERMNSRRFTMKDLDDVSGIGRNVSGRWFADKAQPKLAHIQRAVEALGGRLVIHWEENRDG